MHSTDRVVKIWQEGRREKKRKKLSKSPKLNCTVEWNYTRDLNFKIEDTVSLLQNQLLTCNTL